MATASRDDRGQRENKKLEAVSLSPVPSPRRPVVVAHQAEKAVDVAPSDSSPQALLPRPRAPSTVAERKATMSWYAAAGSRKTKTVREDMLAQALPTQAADAPRKEDNATPLPTTADGQSLGEGTPVTLLTAMFSRGTPEGSRDGREMCAGWHGTIRHVDAKGDMLIEFPHDQTRRWVQASNARGLSVGWKSSGVLASLRECCVGIICCGSLYSRSSAKAGQPKAPPSSHEVGLSNQVIGEVHCRGLETVILRSAQQMHSVEELKQWLAEKTRVPAFQQALYLQQRLLSDEAERPLQNATADNPVRLVLERLAVKKISEFYKLETRKVGVGSFAYVVRAEHLQSRTTRAAKVYSKAQLAKAHSGYVKQELGILRELNHVNIIKCHDHFEDTSSIYLIFELCSGGELMHRILAAGHFNERNAAYLMRQLFSGVQHMHERHVCHRNVKPSNIHFQAKAPMDVSSVKLIDFGSACRFERGVPMRMRILSPHYGSPQMHQGAYSEACDLWSCGVMLFVLLCGYTPFDDESDEEVLLVGGGREVPFGEAWDPISEDASDLVAKLLVAEESARLTAEQALDSEWVREQAPRAGYADLVHLSLLKGCVSTNRLKKAALRFISGREGCEVYRKLAVAFEELDEMGHGMLSPGEFKEALDLAKVPASSVADLRQFAEDTATSNTAWSSWPEILAHKVAAEREDDCRAAFNAWDLNGDGSVSMDEIAKCLTTGGDADMDVDVKDIVEDVTKTLQQVDINCDGALDFEEFMQMMRGEIG